MKTTHFVITGGAGFIGSHVTEQLLSEGYLVTVVDNLETGNLANLPQHPNLTFLQKNIIDCQPEDFAKNIDGIAHLAAAPSVTRSWIFPLDAHHQNLSTTVAIIELVKTMNIPRLVITSSAAVYGNPVALPITENHPTNPISPYGLQKLVSEQYATLFAQHFGFSVISLRLFNVFGERQMPNSPYSGVISIFTKLMLENQSITIYGDGSQTRDFVYVKDVARAFSQALTTPIPLGETITCNIASGKTISLTQLVDALKTCFSNWTGDINFAEARLGDIKHSQANINRANSVLSYVVNSSFIESIQNSFSLSKLL